MENDPEVAGHLLFALYQELQNICSTFPLLLFLSFSIWFLIVTFF